MTPSQLELYNRNGAEMCHAIGCRKHKRLVEVHRGKFCAFHADKLTKIREQMKNFAKNGNIEDEMIKRREEQQMRKVPDYNHEYYIKVLERRQDYALKQYLPFKPR